MAVEETRAAPTAAGSALRTRLPLGLPWGGDRVGMHEPGGSTKGRTG
jgi:hypothetical protein